MRELIGLVIILCLPKVTVVALLVVTGGLAFDHGEGVTEPGP